MDHTPILLLGGLIGALGRSSHKYFLPFLVLLISLWVMVLKFSSERIFGGVINIFVSNFQTSIKW